MNRRDLLAAVPALSGDTVAAPAVANPDAVLIRVCQQFAETEFTLWYRYIVEPDGECVELADATPDWATLHWIEATPAITPEGMRAKALAFVAWHREGFDNPLGDGDAQSALLASLLQDMAAPARAVIVARLIEQYGPLPEGYTPDCRWIGIERIAA
jgi:hypothetical protein